MALTYPTSLPQPNAPFFGMDGSISPVWVNWFLAIQNRTGGTPGIPSTTLQSQVNALFVQYAMSDESTDITTIDFSSLQKQINALFVEQALASEPEPQRFPFFSMETVMAPDDMPAQANPFLAAFLIGDVS